MLCLALSGTFKTTALNKGMRLASQKEFDIRKKIATLCKRLAAENPFLKKYILPCGGHSQCEGWGSLRLTGVT